MDLGDQGAGALGHSSTVLMQILVLIGNKCDLPEREITAEEAMALAQK